MRRTLPRFLPRFDPPGMTARDCRRPGHLGPRSLMWGMNENHPGSPNEHDGRLDRTPMWTVEELSEKLHASPETVRSWRKNGTGPRAYKIGRHVLFEEADVRAWIEAHEIRDRSASRKRGGDAQRGTGW